LKIIFYIPYIIRGLYDSKIDNHKSELYNKMCVLLSFILRFNIIYKYSLKNDISSDDEQYYINKDILNVLWLKYNQYSF
jgi:hypothetical protein